MRNAAFRNYTFTAVVVLALAATAAPSHAINRDGLAAPPVVGAQRLVAFDTPVPMDSSIPPPPPPPPEPTPSGTPAPTPSPGAF